MSKWCDEGENWVVSWIVSNTLYAGLYRNSVEPGEDATLAEIDEPPSEYGYSRITLDPSNWTIAGSRATHTVVEWTASGGSWGDVYGYFITDVGTGYSGKLIAVMHFPNPINVLDGITVRVRPKIEVD